MLAAALAYYTAFAIAPLIILVVAIVGLIVSQDTVQTQILDQIQATVGPDAADLVRGLITDASEPGQGIFSTIVSVVALLFGALGVFEHLQTALDRIWDVEKVETEGGLKGTIMNFLKNKLLSFGMLLVIGFLLLVSLILSAGLSVVDGMLASRFPGADVMLRIVSFVLSFGVITLLFMFIFKFLPHAEIQWRDVWIGAAVTALLFTIGRTLLGLYLANTATASTYGAAGALVVVLLWVYYSAQIVLLGAEFTQVFARRYGSRITPETSADTDRPDSLARGAAS
jgi:membrane protein